MIRLPLDLRADEAPGSQQVYSPNWLGAAHTLATDARCGHPDLRSLGDVSRAWAAPSLSRWFWRGEGTGVPEAGAAVLAREDQEGAGLRLVTNRLDLPAELIAEIQASCAMIVCMLILIDTGEKPNRAMDQVVWYHLIGTHGLGFRSGEARGQP